MTTRGLAVLAIVFLSASLFAQDGRIGETIEVSIVNVDVHVTDKNGNRIQGLEPTDFEIREDGKVQPITNFAEYSSSATAGTTALEGTPAEAPAAPVVVPREPRTVVVFIEPVKMTDAQAKEMFASLRQLLHRIVESGDEVSVITFRHAMEVRQPFTNDLTSVEKTLGELETQMASLAGDRYDVNGAMLAKEAAFEKEFNAFVAGMGIGTPSDSGELVVKLSAARRERFLVRQKAAALEALIQSISGARGRKILIMATQRFGVYAGAEYFDGAVPNNYKQELDTTDYRQALIRSANANGVTIYPVHPEGLKWSIDDASLSGEDRMETTLSDDLGRTSRDNAILLNETAALNEIAVATGGVTAWGSENIAKILPVIGEDLESYYSLAYRATKTGKDGARKITVTTKNPNYVVRARKQFVEKSGITQLKDRVRANLYQRVEGSVAKIPFDVGVGAIRKTGRNRWSVPLRIRIPVASLTTLPEGEKESGQFSVLFATGGNIGLMSDVEQRTQKFDIPRAQLARAKQSYFTYELEMTVDQLVQTLSLAVQDDIGQEFGLKRFSLPPRS